MCGIAGFIDIDQGERDPALLIDRMCRVMRHRGPDEQGVWSSGHVALGMRRLAIIDRSHGQQPLFNEDGSILVVFNGEIYNYQELKQGLQGRGHHFQTSSDTEVLVHAYEEYGEACVTHLRGMFAFALWDARRERLLLARDRFGKKPLQYYWDGHRFLFGSEIKSLLAAGVPRQINPLALDDYLAFGYVPAPLTLFEGVLKVPAAHTLSFEKQKITLQRYWDLSFTPTCQDDEKAASERVRELLRDAVAVRLMSEVPLGAFLSGGVDSSLVVGLMSQMMPQPVKTFSIGFEEEAFNELPYGRQVAQLFGTEHHEFLVRPDLISVLPQLAWAYDEPFSDPSLLPTYYVSKLARDHVTVALTGDGGDEIFGGYTRYQREQTIARLPAAVRTALAAASRVLPEGVRGQKRLRGLAGDLATRYVQTHMLFLPETRHHLYADAYFSALAQHSPLEERRQLFQAVQHLDVTTQLQYVDVQTYLTDDILVKVDKASMLNSLETRAPLLDQHLVEYVASLQPSVRLRNGQLKYLLKQAVADLLPAEILSRRKQGFGVPLKYWLRTDLADYAQAQLTSSKAVQRGIFQAKYIQQLLQQHAQARYLDHSRAIWALLCLETWFQVYIDDDESRLAGPAQERPLIIQ